MAPSVDLESEQRVRAAAFAELRERVARFGPDLPWHVIRAPFHVGGEEILFANRPRGIFKPRQLSAALSIKTTEPRSGRARRYDDLASDEAFIYRYQGVDSQNADNLALRRAFENGLPLIYFYALEAGVYSPRWPAYVESMDDRALSCTIVFSHEEPLVGLAAADPAGRRIERRYATIEVKKRLHPAASRRVPAACRGARCSTRRTFFRTGTREACPRFPTGWRCAVCITARSTRI